MKKLLIYLAIFSLLILNCSKKNITNNYYPSADMGAIVGIVYPPDSGAKVIAYLGMEVASTYIDTTGYFGLTELPIGTYSLLVQAEGYFDYQSKPDISVTGGTAVSVDSIFLASIRDLIYSVSPEDGAEQVRPTVRIRIIFRTEMNTESVESAFHVEPEVEGEFFWGDWWRKVAGSTELHFTPRGQFETNTRYQVTIDTVASDAQGIKLAEPYQFSFTTEPIRIYYTRPADEETWVSPHTFIEVSFNTDMDVESVISAFKIVDSEELKDVMGNIVWGGLQRMRFDPNSVLAANEEYTVTIDTTASDLRGGRLPEPYQFSFTIEPIRILSTSPINKETWVDPSTEVYIGFNTYMDAESVVLAFKMVDSQLKDVTGEFTWSSLRWTCFRPDSTLAGNETYTVTIDTNARDISGGSLDEPYNFWFKTRPY